MSNSLYVHIPFCGAICHYCDFVKFIYNKKWATKYLKELKSDLAFFHVPHNLTTIYIGGGTPTRLSYVELKAFLELLTPYATEVVEYTVEANIESITPKKLELLRSYGVNRLSIGVQTTNDERLVALNRQHTYAQIKRKIRLVKQSGFTNFSVDLIYGLPNQDINELKLDIKNILKLNPPHISTYALEILPNTQAFIHNWPRVTSDESRLLYDEILQTLTTNGYERYEISNFAKPGMPSKHNLVYWHNKPFYAIGIGASGYRNGVRYKISGSLTKYLRGERKLDEDVIDETTYETEYLMLHLRLKAGFKLINYTKEFDCDFKKKYASQLATLKKNGLIRVTNSQVYCTDEGLMLHDQVLLTLLT